MSKSANATETVVVPSITNKRKDKNTDSSSNGLCNSTVSNVFGSSELSCYDLNVRPSTSSGRFDVYCRWCSVVLFSPNGSHGITKNCRKNDDRIDCNVILGG